MVPSRNVIWVPQYIFGLRSLHLTSCYCGPINIDPSWISQNATSYSKDPLKNPLALSPPPPLKNKILANFFKKIVTDQLGVWNVRDNKIQRIKCFIEKIRIRLEFCQAVSWWVSLLVSMTVWSQCFRAISLSLSPLSFSLTLK